MMDFDPYSCHCGNSIGRNDYQCDDCYYADEQEMKEEAEKFRCNCGNKWNECPNCKFTNLTIEQMPGRVPDVHMLSKGAYSAPVMQNAVNSYVRENSLSVEELPRSDHGFYSGPPRKLYNITRDLTEALSCADFPKCIRLMAEMTQRALEIEDLIERCKLEQN